MDILEVIRERLSPAELLDTLTNLRPSRERLLKVGGVLLYGALVFAIVFAAKFYVRQADTLVRQALSAVPGVKVDFPYLEPQIFPPRVTLGYLSIVDSKTRRPILFMRDADIRLSVLPLLAGKVSCSVTSRMYGGLMEADIATGTMFNTDWVSADLKLDMIELNEVPQAREFDRSLKGFASLETSFKGDLTAPETFEGDFYGRLDQLEMDNRYPILKGGRLEGFRVDLDCSLDEGVLTVRDFDVKDQQGLSLKTDGTIAVNAKAVMQSTLALEGKFTGPIERLATSVMDRKAVEKLKKKQAVKVKIEGALSRPGVNLR